MSIDQSPKQKDKQQNLTQPKKQQTKNKKNLQTQKNPNTKIINRPIQNVRNSLFQISKFSLNFCSLISGVIPNFLNFKQIRTAKTQPPSTEVLQLFSEIKKQQEESQNLWDKDQDEKLISLVDLHKEKQWGKISKEFENFDQIDCLLRHRKITNVTTKKGSWNSAEDQLLLRCVERLGNTVWPQVSGLLPGRNPKQCRERWRNQLNPNINRGPFTKEEEELLIKKQAELGTRWCVLSTFFKGRPDNMLKNYWYSLQAQKKKQKNSKKKYQKKKKSQTSQRKRKSSTKQRTAPKPKTNHNHKTTKKSQETTTTTTAATTATTTTTKAITTTKQPITQNNYSLPINRLKRNYDQTEKSESLPNKVFFTSQTQSQLFNSFENFFKELNAQKSQDSQIPQKNLIAPKLNQFQDKTFKWTNFKTQDFESVSLESIHNEEIALEATSLYSTNSEILIDYSEPEIPRSPTQEIISDQQPNFLQLQLDELEKDPLSDPLYEEDIDLTFIAPQSSSLTSAPNADTLPSLSLSFPQETSPQNIEPSTLGDQTNEPNLAWKNTIEFDTENSYTEIWSEFENLETVSDDPLWELEETNDFVNYNSLEFD
ncbi:transcription factor myb3r-4 [Anaeramoeba flamelloides]|uniref:Transcription factor myb3r-4 n=1 Tax=Anaeramoeba flamelloides TaxID=1746091 RepID=A0AAV7Z305_9EUKA|nr:transcription factor myb3r-4 [Anaeramoeba flamelloides]